MLGVGEVPGRDGSGDHCGHCAAAAVRMGAAEPVLRLPHAPIHGFAGSLVSGERDHGLLSVGIPSLGPAGEAARHRNADLSLGQGRSDMGDALGMRRRTPWGARLRCSFLIDWLSAAAGVSARLFGELPATRRRASDRFARLARTAHLASSHERETREGSALNHCQVRPRDVQSRLSGLRFRRWRVLVAPPIRGLRAEYASVWLLPAPSVKTNSAPPSGSSA